MLVTSRKVKIETGTEGPRHDPYSYTELHVFTTYEGGKEVDITIHQGLVNFMKVNGMLVDTEIEQFLLELLGITFKSFMKSIMKAQYINENTCKHCGNTKTYSQPTYPGETLYLCTKCEEVVYADFDITAVM